MKNEILVAGAILLLISTNAYAALSGSVTGTGSDKASACSNAKNEASRQMEQNRRDENPFNRKNYRGAIEGCQCSEPKKGNSVDAILSQHTGWVCEASWSISLS